MLKAYVASFDPGFVALRGTPEQTQAAAKDFKVFYAKVPGKTEGSYTDGPHRRHLRLRRRRARCGCSCATAAAPRRWRHDLKLLLAERPERG